MNRELDHLVDDCLTKMQTDGWSVEQCLDAYPEYREVLGPLLMLSETMHASMAPESPGELFASNAWKRIQNQLQTSLTKRTIKGSRQQRSRRTRWFLRPAYAIASIALVIALLMSGFGVVSASAASLPGDTLYGLKRARERLTLTFSITPEGDQELLTRFAEDRLQEAEALVEQNRLDDLTVALQGLEETLDQLGELTEENEDLQPGSLNHLELRLDKHIQVLERVMENAPENAREALQHAIDRSTHSREVIEKVRGEGHPSDLAPGQNKPDAEDQGTDTDKNKDKDKDKDKENSSGNPGQGRGPKTKEDKENGPPSWANDD